MQKKVTMTILVVSLLLLLCQFSYGWENMKTHPALTGKALDVSVINDYFRRNLECEDWWGFGNPEGIYQRNCWYFTPARWSVSAAKFGYDIDCVCNTHKKLIELYSSAEDEDDEVKPWPPLRPRHHFHDPLRDSGLNNKDDFLMWPMHFTFLGSMGKFDLTGESALRWARWTDEDETSVVEPKYNWSSWSWARYWLLNAITAQQPGGWDGRSNYLSGLMISIGSFCHLIEDMGVPVVRKPELARALYSTVKLDEPVPNHLYMAVAEVLAMIYRLRQQRTQKR